MGGTVYMSLLKGSIFWAVLFYSHNKTKFIHLRINLWICIIDAIIIPDDCSRHCENNNLDCKLNMNINTVVLWQTLKIMYPDQIMHRQLLEIKCKAFGLPSRQTGIYFWYIFLKHDEGQLLKKWNNWLLSKNRIGNLVMFPLLCSVYLGSKADWLMIKTGGAWSQKQTILLGNYLSKLIFTTFVMGGNNQHQLFWQKLNLRPCNSNSSLLLLYQLNCCWQFLVCRML